MVIFNTLLSIAAIWVIITINNRYLIPSLKNKNRFKLYRLRDELSLLAMRGDLNENSIEYVTLIELINRTIKATGTFRVSLFIRFLVEVNQNAELKKKIMAIKSRVSKNENKEYCRIASAYFEVAQKILYSDTRVLRHVIFPAFKVIGFVLTIINLNKTQKYARYKGIIKDVNSSLDDNRHQFEQLCMH